jgi:ubiquinone/menaquinone biosynthesis C-methylase UbiE
MNSIRPLLSWAFNRLYNEAAWAYDWAATVAGGRYWYAWGETAVPFVQAGPVLEVGIGQGKLLPLLAAAEHQPVVGVDLSMAMLRRARGALRGSNGTVGLVQADGGTLPFPSAHFGTLLTVFPAPYVTTIRTQREFARVLRPGGRWLWVDAPRNAGSVKLSGGLTTLFPAPMGDLAAQLAELEQHLFNRDESGCFEIQINRVEVGPTTVLVRVATKVAL